MTDLAPHLGAFLREHLPQRCNASQHTIASYADSFVLLLGFAAGRLGIRPSAITIEHLTTDLLFGFLDHLEADRGNSVGTRNVRLAAIKSFFHYLEYRLPACLDLAMQVDAMPMKRHDERAVAHLERAEVRALLDAPDPATASGRRDRAMLHLAYAAGLRVSELVAVRIPDLSHPDLDSVRVTGKGRRERTLPLWRETRGTIRDWLVARPACGCDHLFVNARRAPMSRHGFAHRLALHAEAAAKSAPTIADKRVFPHILRHSCAMHTLEATGDIRKVSLWLGHAAIRSTEIYLRSDPARKLDILGETVPPSIGRGTFKDAPDRVMMILSEVRAPRKW